MQEKPDLKNTVLVVDDDDAIRESVKCLLELNGFGAVTACNGKEAFDLLKNHKVSPKVILLDIRMPIMDGWEFQEARKSMPEFAKIPLFVFCAGNKQENQPPVTGATGFLSKPIDIEDLLSSIKPYLH